jgi:hypothetical protein
VDSLSQTIDQLTSYSSTLRQYVQDTLLGEDSPLGVMEQLAQAAAQFNSTLAAAHGGDADARSQLTGKAGSYLSSLKSTAGSRVDYAMGYAKVTSALLAEATSADSSIQIAKDQLAAEKAQLEQLGLLNSNVQTFAQAWAAYQGAQANLAAAKAAVASAGSSYTPAPSAAASVAAASSVVDNSGYTGIMAGTIDRDHFATGGWHWGGYRVVGENGPELEATGASYIHDAATTRRILSGGGGNASDDMALLEELRGLRAEMQANVQFTFILQKDIRELKQRGFPVTNSPDGEPLTVQ